MSDNILDIRKWKRDYPFINTVLDTYNEFDKDVVDNENQSNFYVLCNQIVTESKGDLNIHRDICMKLMRNLGYFAVVPKFYQLTGDRCNILYNWIYNLINEKKITDNVINKCFEMYNIYMDKIKNYRRCNNFSNEKINEPVKITLLDIFDNNTQIIKDTLINQDKLINTPCRKFVCECVKIYKQMYDAYCLNKEGKTKYYKNSCLKLEQFKGVYNVFRSNLGHLNTSVPSLDDKDNEFLEKCPPGEQDTSLRSDKVVTRDLSLGNGLPAHAGDRGLELTDYLHATHGNVDSPMKKTITTTIGTFAGASSLLAFLYKFTPAGRLVNPKLRRTKGMINNNFYGEEANGMLFDGNEHNGLNSYNIGYEAV